MHNCGPHSLQNCLFGPNEDFLGNSIYIFFSPYCPISCYKVIIYHPRVDPRYKNLHNIGQPSGLNFSFGQQKNFFWIFNLMYFHQLIVPYDAAHFEKNP